MLYLNAHLSCHYISSTDSTAYMSYAELISPLEGTNQIHFPTKPLSTIAGGAFFEKKKDHPAIGPLAQRFSSD